MPGLPDISILNGIDNLAIKTRNYYYDAAGNYYVNGGRCVIGSPGCFTADDKSKIDRLNVDANDFLKEVGIPMMRDATNSSFHELYKAPGSYTQSFEMQYQTTMITGILCAMLGTTVLYYAFTKM